MASAKDSNVSAATRKKQSLATKKRSRNAKGELKAGAVNKPKVPTASKLAVKKAPVEKKEPKSILSYSVATRKKHAGSLYTEDGVLLELAWDTDFGVLAELVQNPNISEEILGILADKYSDYIKLQVAYNEHTSGMTLSGLVTYYDEEVREAVAENDNTRTEDLDALASDKSWRVRRAVAMNSRTSESALLKLTNDDHWEVLLGIADNIKLSEKVLSALIEKADKKVDDSEYARYYTSQRILSTRGLSPEIKEAAKNLRKVSLKPLA